MTAIFIFLWAFAANWLAYTKGFYRLPKQSDQEIPSITGFQLIAIFGIYVILSLLITRVILVYLLANLKHHNPSLTALPISMTTGLQFGIMAMLVIILQWFMFGQNRDTFYKIWKNRTHQPASSIFLDLWIGGITWFMSFPLVSIISDLVDTAMKALFHLKDYEQNAVKFVKIAQSTPISLTFALLSVLVAAPFLEEFLFRGVLQTYLKKKMGPQAAILLSAFFFALFHFAEGQGLGNVSLIISLLILGTFLGFLYERQGSLWAPIGLHMAFNGVSAFRILFIPDAS